MINWIDRIVLKYVFGQVATEVAIQGWKVKTAAVIGILGGLALVLKGVNDNSFDEAKQGVGAIVLSLGGLGLGHKQDKQIAATKAQTAALLDN